MFKAGTWLEAETEAETSEECYSLAYSVTFPIQPRTTRLCRPQWTQPFCSQPASRKMAPRRAHTPASWRQFLSRGPLFPEVSGVVTKTMEHRALQNPAGRAAAARPGRAVGSRGRRCAVQAVPGRCRSYVEDHIMAMSRFQQETLEGELRWSRLGGRRQARRERLSRPLFP